MNVRAARALCLILLAVVLILGFARAMKPTPVVDVCDRPQGTSSLQEFCP